MRRRSGGIHCQTYEELIKTCKDPVTPPSAPDSFKQALESSSFFDIDMFLQEQMFSQPPQNHHQSFFFSEKEELLAEEEEETNRPQNIRSVEIAIICQELQTVHNHLLTLSQAQKFLQDSSQKHPQIPIFFKSERTKETSGITHQVQNQQCSGTRAVLLNEREYCNREFEKGEGSFQILQNGQQRLLELVVYNNHAGDYNLKHENLSYLNTTQIWQHKLWLLAQTEIFSSIRNIYLKKCKYIFFAKVSHHQIELIPTTINQELFGSHQKNQKTSYSIQELMDGRLFSRPSGKKQ